MGCLARRGEEEAVEHEAVVIVLRLLAAVVIPKFYLVQELCHHLEHFVLLDRVERCLDVHLDKVYSRPGGVSFARRY